MAKTAPLSLREEEILRTVRYYRYITTQDIIALYFTPSVKKYAQALMAKLAGNEDLDTHNYLCRFTLPSVHKRAQEKVYVLGSAGRRVLKTMGLSVDWYFRPHKLKFLSYSYIIHNLILTRFLVACEKWTRDHPTYSLSDKRICYELSGKVIPDAWVMFTEETKDGIYDQAIMFEIDRGMEARDKFRQHVLGRIDYFQSGEYKKTFNTNTACVAYATTGQLPEYREARRKAMCAMIMQVLKERRLENWAGVFKVTSLEFHTLYDNALLEDEVWYRPDSPKPRSLFYQ
jgi:hypothetical protein